MGVEYKHYLFPKNRAYRPTSEVVEKLVARLQDAAFLPKGSVDGSSGVESFFKVVPNTSVIATASQNEQVDEATAIAAQMLQQSSKGAFDFADPSSWFRDIASHDFYIGWYVSNREASNLKHPLAEPNPNTESADDCDYYLSLMSTHDYEDFALDELTGIVEPECACGAEMKYEVPGDLCLGMLEKIAFTCPGCGAQFNASDLESWTTVWNTNDAITIAGGGLARFSICVDVMKAIPVAAPTFQPEFIQICTDVLGEEFVQVGEIG